MNTEDARTALVTAVSRAVPGADVATVDPSAPMREELELDSLDFLAVVQALHDLTGVEIPEAEYDQVTSVDDTVRYLCAHSSG